MFASKRFSLYFCRVEDEIYFAYNLLAQDTLSGFVNIRDLHNLCYGHYKITAENITDWLLYKQEQQQCKTVIFGGSTYVKLT